MDNQRRLDTLKKRQTDLKFVLEHTPQARDARVILSGLLAELDKEILELERAIRLK
jgi:hypothetical protein